MIMKSECYRKMKISKKKKKKCEVYVRNEYLPLCLVDDPKASALLETKGGADELQSALRSYTCTAKPIKQVLYVL